MPLTYRDRGTGDTQLDVLCGEIVIASVRKSFSVVAKQEPYWQWTFNFTARPPGFELHGSAASREIACLAVERNWEAWLTAAGLTHARQIGE
jgi:hypothetical protein